MRMYVRVCVCACVRVYVLSHMRMSLLGPKAANNLTRVRMCECLCVITYYDVAFCFFRYFPFVLLPSRFLFFFYFFCTDFFNSSTEFLSCIFFFYLLHKELFEPNENGWLHHSLLRQWVRVRVLVLFVCMIISLLGHWLRLSVWVYVRKCEYLPASERAF